MWFSEATAWLETSAKWVNLFFLSLFSPHTSEMFSSNMYIKQVVVSKSDLEGELMVGVISKGPDAKEYHIFTHTSSISKTN